MEFTIDSIDSLCRVQNPSSKTAFLVGAILFMVVEGTLEKEVNSTMVCDPPKPNFIQQHKQTYSLFVVSTFHRAGTWGDD